MISVPSVLAWMLCQCEYEETHPSPGESWRPFSWKQNRHDDPESCDAVSSSMSIEAK
ncbi:hypothetical protein ASZ90_016829 [hydrocarbon metagenome]|uniref:Uncharacterized protein n=1 Tax=hydrocarbon metagenome TaxID=938273 RepID=A0A0W8EAR1_9ZZZZ